MKIALKRVLTPNKIVNQPTLLITLVVRPLKKIMYAFASLVKDKKIRKKNNFYKVSFSG